MSTVKELMGQIKAELKHASASNKDEARVMAAMLNDTGFKVGVYDSTGKVGEVCIADDYRNILANAISSTTKISKEEATVLTAGYEAKKADAERMLNIVKTFPFEYMRNTGRTFKLGGREKSNITLSFKDVQASTRSFPKQEGIDKDGKAIYVKTEVKVPGYESIKVQNPCPAWVKK